MRQKQRILDKDKKRESKRKEKKSSSRKKKAQNIQLTEEDLNFSMKEHLVEEFANRWWYALPKWPPANYDYT